MSLSPFTRLELADLAERITDDDPDGAAVIRSALTEDADDQDTADAGESGDAGLLAVGSGEVWADSYARSIAGGLSATLAARHADAAEAHARHLLAGVAEGVKP